MDNMVHIYIGDGKGKSTAALGLALRAAGAGLKVMYCQFLKQEDSSELASLEHIPNITIMRGEPTDGFLFFMDDEQKETACNCALERLNRAECAIKSGEYDLVILDEFLWVLTSDIISCDYALDLMQAKKCELVLTGGHAPDELIEAADYVSEIKKIAHPFDRDIPARRGIEY